MKKLQLIAIAFIFIATNAYASYDYKQFYLSLEPIQVSISNENLKLDPVVALDIDEVGNIKDSALAMAMGYCIFLELTKIDKDLLEASNNKTGFVNDVMSGLSVNYWLTTVWQESHLAMDVGGRAQNYPAQSGLYQLDIEPLELYNSVHRPYGETGTRETAAYYNFLKDLNGGTNYGPGEGKKDAILCRVDQQGFIWASLEMAYYTAYSYNANKDSYNNIPYKDYSVNDWFVKYIHNSKNTTNFPFDKGPITVDNKKCEIPEEGSEINSYYIGTQFLGFLYNRGQQPFANPHLEQCKIFINMINEESALAEGTMVPYPKTNEEEPNEFVRYAKRYFWQFGWVITMLNKSHNHYTEIIKYEDVESVLTKLKGFYNGENKDDQAVEAGIKAAKALNWDKQYDSPETFENIQKVTKAMMDASLKKEVSETK
jgi:hypothetical protein